MIQLPIDSVNGRDIMPSKERLAENLVYSIAVVAVLWHVYYSFTIFMARGIHANLHLGMLMGAYFLSKIDRESSSLTNILNSFLAIAIAACTLYVHFVYDRWINVASVNLVYTQLDVIVGAAVILIVLYAIHISFGKALTIVIGTASFYGIAGNLFPGALSHPGVDLETFVFQNTIQLTGIYGSLLGLGATWIVIFLMYAGLVEGYGGLHHIIYAGSYVSKYVKSGAAQIAVLSSMAIGSILASTMANTATTGTFTIPLMKDRGIRAKTAAAIEAVAGNGGQIFPPIMGSTAFIMSDILGLPYIEILRGAFLPALLFYISLVVTIHLLVVKNEWYGSGSETTEDLVDGGDDFSAHSKSKSKKALLELVPILVSLVVLLWFLIIQQTNPMRAGGWAIISLVVAELGWRLFREGISSETVRNWAKGTVEGSKQGTLNMAPITAVLAGLGIVVYVLNSTGLGFVITSSIIDITGGSFMLLLLAAGAASIMFGMGVPTPAAYLLVAVITAPILVRYGVEQLVSHMFVFYLALLSSITPPVATSSAVAAGIAGSEFWETAVESSRIGVILFILPVAYVINPELIVWTSSTPLKFVLIAIGAVSLSFGLIGHNLIHEIDLPRRVVYLLITGLIFFLSSTVIQVLACVGLFVVLSIEYIIEKGQLPALQERFIP